MLMCGANKVEECSKKYQHEIIDRGKLDRACGKTLDHNPYSAIDYQWLDSKLDAIRLLTSAPNVSAVERALSRLSAEEAGIHLQKSSVVDLATRIETIRESADKLWENGWLQGHPPDEPLDLDSLLADDGDSD